MPLSTESIQNTPLSGSELIEVIVADVRDLLARDGMFSSYVAYRRLSYQIDVRLQTGNPYKPEHTARIRSKADASAGAELYPLAPPPDTLGQMEIVREREIDSPNLTRIANELPIVAYAQEHGKTVAHNIAYKKEGYPQPKPPTDTQTKK